MTYQPQLGDYGCVSTSSFIGFLIQLGTMTKYNHAFIYVGNNQIIEAMPGGVRLSPVSKYENIAWNRHEEIADAQRDLIVKEALTHLGNKYSFIDYLAIIMRMTGFMAPYWLTNRLAKSSNTICSELVARVYRKIGLTIEGDKPDYYITPSDLIYRLLYI